MGFFMNDYIWHVIFVDEKSPMLIDRTGSYRLATTDPNTMCVYLSSRLSGDFLLRVLVHEIAHCALFSYHLIDDLHRMIKEEYLIDAEEWVCNFIADYGNEMLSVAGYILQNGGYVNV